MSVGFTIVVPTYNRAEFLRNSLPSVQRLRVPSGWDIELLVVDNNSVDHTVDVIRDIAKWGAIPVRWCLEKQQGASHSRNRALKEARFEHLVYLDDDMVVDAGWLEGYLEALETYNPDLVVGPVEPWFEEAPGPDLTQRMLDSLTSAYSRKGDDLLLLSPDQGHEVPGCNFAIRRRAALEAGGFETRIDRSGGGMLGGGDWELGEKLVLLGKKVAYAPRCRIRHFVSRYKMSRPALRARWEGMGASHRALLRLRGQEPARARKIRLFLRMNRYLLRSLRSYSANKRAEAFQWELEARRLRGFLFKCPAGVKPRSWPPAALSLPSDLQA